MSKTPTEYSELKRVRDFEKSVLRKSFRRLCEPGNHIPNCPRDNRHCPHRDEELVTDGGVEWAECDACGHNSFHVEYRGSRTLLKCTVCGNEQPTNPTQDEGADARMETDGGGRDYEQELETMRAKAQELLTDDELETFALVTQTSTDLNTVTGSNQEEPTADLLMSVYGIADNVATRMNVREDMGMTPVDVMKWATHFKEEHAETGERGIHDLSRGDGGGEPMTDGGREDPLWTANLADIPENERERYERRREIFTCDDCGEVADAMVSVDDPATLTMVGKSWVDIHHTDSDDGGPTLYIHVKEDEVDRGADLRKLLSEHSETDEEQEPDPYENPEPPVDDRPDLDQFHRMKARQGRDPHGPRTDGGVDTSGADHVEWWEKAGRNVDKWGLQDPDALILAMMEELGELANQMVMYSNRGDTSLLGEHGRDHIRRIADLGTDTREFLEATSEDENNNPIPPAERPQYYDAFPPDLRASSRVHQLGSELSDLMALGFQFQWRLNSDTGDGGDDRGE